MNGCAISGSAVRMTGTAFAVIACTAAAPCFAQSAIVRVTHNDPNGIVNPGQTVQIRTTVSWQVPQGNSGLFSIAGDVHSTPNAGIASNSTLSYSLVSGPNLIAAPGTPSLGSVEGVHLEYGSINWILFGQIPPAPWGFSRGFDIVSFDWTAPANPDVVTFGWEPSNAIPQPLIACTGWNPPVQTVPTTYFGTSITVVPAPPAALSLGIAALGSASRHRRP